MIDLQSHHQMNDELAWQSVMGLAVIISMCCTPAYLKYPAAGAARNGSNYKSPVRCLSFGAECHHRMCMHAAAGMQQ
jgi:hypothetical protein